MIEVFLNQLSEILGTDLDMNNDLFLIWDDSASFNKKLKLAEFASAFITAVGWRSRSQAVIPGTNPITFATPFPVAIGGNYTLSITIVDANGNVPYGEPINKTKDGFDLPDVALAGTLTYQALPYA